MPPIQANFGVFARSVVATTTRERTASTTARLLLAALGVGALGAGLGCAPPAREGEAVLAVDERASERPRVSEEPPPSPSPAPAIDAEGLAGGERGGAHAASEARPDGVGSDPPGGAAALRRREPRRAREAPGTLFDPRDDARVLERLRSEAVVQVERGRGGRSVAFRVTLESGARAYFKPEQTFSGTRWNAEIAAFHLDRELGLGRTAPSTGRALPWALLEPALAGDPRASEVIVGDDGAVRGALIAWIDERLVPIAPPPGWEAELRLDGRSAGPSPFVSQRAMRRLLEADGFAARELDGSPAPPLDELGITPHAEEVGPAMGGALGWDRERRAAELSSLVAFDFLIHNADRWGGRFTNVRTRGLDGPLIYLDNAAGFARRRARVAMLDLRLAFVERFEASFVRGVRRFDGASLRARLLADPLAPLLDEEQLAHLEERRRALLAHVDALIAARGEAAVLAW